MAKIFSLASWFYFIDVRGWPVLQTDQEKGHWISEYSDHGVLFLEMEL